MTRLLLMMGVVLLAGCGEQPYRTFRLSGSKETVRCRFTGFAGCGVWLGGCSDGIERHCATNVEELP